MEFIFSNVVFNIVRYYELENDLLMGMDGEKLVIELLFKLSYKLLDNILQKRVSICVGKQCLQFLCWWECMYYFMFEMLYFMKEMCEFFW